MSSLVSEGGTGPADQRPLNDREYALLQRLLSDPLSLPIEFKTWLISYLETSDLTIPMSSVMGLNSTLGISGAGQGTLGIFPAGLILPFAGDTAPTGSLPCDGGSYSRTAQQRLWTAIGLRYTVGDDGLTFNVPDLQGRAAVGKGPHSDVDTVGKSDGVAAAARRPKHGHTASQWQFATAGAGVGWVNDLVTTASGVRSDRSGAVGPVSAVPPTDAPAYLVVNYIIVN